jgi:hypothetical protein
MLSQSVDLGLLPVAAAFSATGDLKKILGARSSGRASTVDVNGEVGLPKSRLVPSRPLICDQDIRLAPPVQ